MILLGGHSFWPIEPYFDNAFTMKNSGFFISFCMLKQFCVFHLLVGDVIYVRYEFEDLSNICGVIIGCVSGIVGASFLESDGFNSFYFCFSFIYDRGLF